MASIADHGSVMARAEDEAGDEKNVFKSLLAIGSLGGVTLVALVALICSPLLRSLPLVSIPLARPALQLSPPPPVRRAELDARSDADRAGRCATRPWWGYGARTPERARPTSAQARRATVLVRGRIVSAPWSSWLNALGAGSSWCSCL